MIIHSEANLPCGTMAPGVSTNSLGVTTAPQRRAGLNSLLS